jgi:hypothetical protein
VLLADRVRPQDTYTATVDGNKTVANGNPNGPDAFNATLFGQSGLPSGAHSASLANTPTASGTHYVDLDWAVIETGDGNPNTVSSDFTMDESHPNVTYDSGWAKGDNSGGLLGQYWNNTFM